MVALAAAAGAGRRILPADVAARPFFTAFAVTLLAVAARTVLESVIPDVAPFALFYLAVTAAALLSGSLAGIITVILCQGILWLFVIPARPELAGTTADLVGLALGAGSQCVIVACIGEYKRLAVRALEDERRERERAELAMRELDHRTKNNFQLAIGILRERAARYPSAELRGELDLAAFRLVSLEAAHANLVVAHRQGDQLSFRDYLAHMVARLREGLEGANVEFVVIMPDLSMDRSRAISVGLILNEMITNSAKHAFAGRPGIITISGRATDRKLIIDIGDNGPGFAEGGPARDGEPGIGRHLLLEMAETIDTTIERLPGAGASYRITVPLARS